MLDLLSSRSADPSLLMAPDAERLTTFADGLAEDGEEDLSDLVRTVAESLAVALEGTVSSAAA